MIPFDAVLALGVLVGAVATGILAHELLHTACLRAAGVPSTLQLGGGNSRWLGAGLGAFASVHVERLPAGVSPWQLRVASLSPLVLTAPLLGIGLGVLPDPFASSNVLAQAALIGWLACALPSPQDFSQFWHADDLVSGDVAVAAADQ